MSSIRFMELEIKVAYQEDLVQELNKIVALQQQQIDRLDATVRMLHERIKGLPVERQSGDNNQFEKPPHY